MEYSGYSLMPASIPLAVITLTEKNFLQHPAQFRK